MNREYFLEREFIVNKNEIFFEAEDMLHFSKPIDDIVFRLPEEATLYVDLSEVDYIEYPFALFAFVTQQKSHFPPKHLVFVEPKEAVLQSMDEIGKNHSTCFVCLKDGYLKVIGLPIAAYAETILRELIGINRWSSIKELMKLEGIQRSFARNHQVLKALAEDGIIRTKKQAKDQGKPGRPSSLFLPFWPQRAKSWNIRDQIYTV